MMTLVDNELSAKIIAASAAISALLAKNKESGIIVDYPHTKTFFEIVASDEELDSITENDARSLMQNNSDVKAMLAKKRWNQGAWDSYFQEVRTILKTNPFADEEAQQVGLPFDEYESLASNLFYELALPKDDAKITFVVEFGVVGSKDSRKRFSFDEESADETIEPVEKPTELQVDKLPFDQDNPPLQSQRQSTDSIEHRQLLKALYERDEIIRNAHEKYKSDGTIIGDIARELVNAKGLNH